MEIKRVFDILDKLKHYAPKKDILNAKVNKQWASHSVDDFITVSRQVGSALLHLDFKNGDVVAIMAGNMPEWNFVDYGAQQVGMPTAPIFPTISNDDLKYILNHSEASIIFISEKSTWLKLAALEKDLPHLKHVFSFTKIDGVRHFSEFLELGKLHPADEKIEQIRNSISEEDLLTILYTSGTTGQPKGVMLSHKNLVSNVLICQDIAPFTTKWKALSFLPLNHVYERFLNTLYLYHGVSIYYAESFETIGDNCRDIHPQIFVAVPRVLERVLERIMSAGEKLTGFKRKIFDWSISLAERYELLGANGMWYEIQRKLADRLVYKKWRAAVGGEIEVIVSGGAALNPRIERMFACAGLTLLQGYGLTETCVVVAVNRLEPRNRMFGTVGLVVENSQVKIDESDGEILMKGPSVMMGYYKNPEATAEVIDKDGWFHTGDIGTFIDGRFLKITDRKKELFKSSSGKYISPVAIENKLKESRHIEQCMVIGEGQKFASALIIPSASSFRELFTHHGIEWPAEPDITRHEKVREVIAEHIKRVNESLAAYEQLKRYQLIHDSWTVESGEVTPKLSLRRRVILEKHRETLRKIFGSGD
jgi:long-chain acyl-CoA synthetase